MRVRPPMRVKRPALIAATALCLALSACSADDDSAAATTVRTAPPSSPPTSEPDQALEVAQAEEWARRFGTLLSSGRIAEAANLFSPDWVKLGIHMTEGGWGIVPPEERGDAFGVPAPLVDGLAFIATWMTVDLTECRGTLRGAGRAAIRCVATLSGPYPEAMDLRPFELPVVFTATNRGLVEYGTDFDLVENDRFTGSEATETYVEEFPRFVLYASANTDFSSTYTRGSGRPVITPESASAHIELAKEWVAAGKP